MFDTIIARLSVQCNMSPRIGGIINIYQTTAIMYAPLTLVGVATTLYGLWGRDLIAGYLPWFTIYHLLGFMVAFILIAMVFFYKFIIPSMVAFNVQQQYKHRNPMASDLQRILDMLENDDKRLIRIEDMLRKIDGARPRSACSPPEKLNTDAEDEL